MSPLELQPPNPRLQRTRLRAPLSRKTFGAWNREWTRKLACLFLTCLSCFAGSYLTAGEPSTWLEVAPAGAGFSIRMPGRPVERFDPETSVTHFQLTEGDRSYIASVAYLPREVREKTSAEQLLEKTKATFLKYLPGSRLISSETLKIGNFPGVVCMIQAQAPGRPEFKLKMSAVVANGRLYNFGFISRSDAFVEKDVDAYLATFRLR